jgi:hypothetical protein
VWGVVRVVFLLPLLPLFPLLPQLSSPFLLASLVTDN